MTALRSNRHPVLQPKTPVPHAEINVTPMIDILQRVGVSTESMRAR